MAERQVTSEDVEKSDKVPVVLRVKRKRTDDPAESLGVCVCCMYSCCMINFDKIISSTLQW